MNTRVLTGGLIAIIVIAAILYLISYFMRRKNQERLDRLEDRKIDLFDLPVIEELDEVKKMHLVGQSQNTFREWNQKWNDLSTTSFAELESRIFDVENLNDSFRFMRAKKAIESCRETLEEMELEVAEIREGLKELRESEERNSMEVQHALDVYEELAERLKNDAESFGPALPELQKQIKNIETEFTQFVTLNTTGDPVEARDVLEQAEQQTYNMENMMNRIPAAYQEVADVFPDQIKELAEGYQKLLTDHYVFPEKTLDEDIKKLEKKQKAILEDLERCEIDTVEVSNQELSQEIDDIYEIMEREISARQYVRTNQQTISDFIHHALRNNRQLMIEIDHTSQSYTLNHNELGRSRGYQAQLEEMQKSNNTVDEKIKNNTVIYSETKKFYEKTFQILDELESNQVEIDQGLQELRKGEKHAQEMVDDFEFRMRNLKREVEKHRLPGLPSDYLEFFFVATDRIEELAKELNKIRINMVQINKLVDLCEEDIQILDKKTRELIDSAALTEQMLQYANRYRHSHQGIRDAIDNSIVLFNKDFRYQQALDEIGTALERVEPGAFKRIEAFYYNDKNHRDIV